MFSGKGEAGPVGFGVFVGNEIRQSYFVIVAFFFKKIKFIGGNIGNTII